ncbi:MAG: hypothetical protein WCY11_17795 [Novosphingobium sp.]
MRSRPNRALALLSGPALLALGGCVHDTVYLGGPDNFGEANRQTFAAQVIDPQPEYDELVPETSAEHAAQAVERYRQDKVKQPDRVKTSDLDTGGPGK